MSSDKARNWSAADELSGVFCEEADEFTQFEAAPIQQNNQGVTIQLMKHYTTHTVYILCVLGYIVCHTLIMCVTKTILKLNVIAL